LIVGDTKMYIKEIEEALKIIRDKSFMVLSTSFQDIVTSRNMSVITINDKIYCQTDKNMVKAKQISKNNNISLCVDNIQIVGKAKFIGTWNENKDILSEYKKIHTNSYEKYKNVADEIVIEIVILAIKLWEYKNSKPYIIEIDLIKNTYKSNQYII
jgi:general stress protein 26